MKGVRVELLSEEPLIISDGATEGLGHKCLDYIPGNMLLGACVNNWKLMHPKAQPDLDKEFCNLFLERRIYFGHAVPSCQGRPAVPTPLSLAHARSEKGLPAVDINPIPAPKVHNLLQQQPQDVECATLLPLNSYFLDVQSRHVPQVQHMHIMHVALDSLKRRAREHQLFGYEAVSSGTTFISTIYCEDQLVDTLRKLLPEQSTVRLGHCRSTGYGTVRICKLTECKVPDEVTIKPGEHSLFFESAFFPMHSWEMPLDALQNYLQQYLGADTEIITSKVFTYRTRTEGFNGIWELPRMTRIGLCQGTVVAFKTAKGGKLPAFLGQWLEEGFGRVQVDLPLLQEAQIVPTQLKTAPPAPQARPKSIILPILNVWRKRSAKRIAEQQAVDLIWHSIVFQPLFASLKTQNKPSQNQRGNIRRMIMSMDRTEWVPTFTAMLSKQPGRQWKTVRIANPFLSYRQRGNLDDIMLKFLDLEQLEAWLKTADREIFETLPELPGQPLSPAEAMEFRCARHKRLLLELLRRWEKEIRAQEGSK